MFQNKDMMPTSVHIQETHKKRSDTIVDYLFPGYSTSFILLRRDIYSKIFPNITFIELIFFVGWRNIRRFRYPVSGIPV